MTTNGYCNTNLNASKIKMDIVIGEVKELLFECKSFSDVKEEFLDVVYTGLCALNTYTGIGFIPVPNYSVNKILDRIVIWEEIFKDNNLEFKVKYLDGGSNYKKESKVKLALDKAIKEQLA